MSNPTTTRDRKLAAMSQLIADQIGRKNLIIEFHFVFEVERGRDIERSSLPHCRFFSITDTNLDRDKMENTETDLH